jgi:methionyl-tRNA formyltransferase
VTADLNLVFLGTAPLAAASLRALHASRHFQIAAVVTQPDKPAGRDLQVQFSAVKEAALAAGLTVLQPKRARDEAFIQEIRTLAPDLIIVAAYGQILPQALLDVPRFGCLNVHASLLPRYRGAAPIQWAILDGLPETGVTIMKMDAGLDTGPMLTKVTTPIAPDDTAGTLHDRLARLGADLLLTTIPRYVSGEIIPEPQPANGASYARKIIKEDGWIDWTRPAGQIECQVRGLSPWPSAFTQLETGSGPLLLKVWRAVVAPDVYGAAGTVVSTADGEFGVACGQGGLRIMELQREGRRRMATGEFLAGCRIEPGMRLGRF